MKFAIFFIMALLVAMVASAAIPDADDSDVDVTLTLSDEGLCSIFPLQ